MNDSELASGARHRRPPSALIEELRARFADRLSTSKAARMQHGRDESPFAAVPPDAVVHVHDSEEVAAVVSACARYRVPVIPYGIGSSLEGQLLAVQGGISVDLSQMNRIVSIAADDLTATVEAGVTREQLNAELRETGLFFPIDPGANATIGGMSATRASGTNAVRYGTMRENVLGLAVVTSTGERIRTGTRARKSSAGYDLTRLFVGSEGTLGVITEVSLRLYPQPEAVSAATVSFADVRGAVDTVIQTIQIGVPVARSEFLDSNAIRAINAYSRLGLAEQPTLFFEFHGSPDGVAEQARVVQDIARENGGRDFEWATRPEDRSRLWSARHKAYFAGLQLRPGARAITTDTCVPISRLADSLIGARAILDRARVPTAILGHVGDGNFHCMLMVDPGNPDEMAECERLNAEIVRLALAMDGTCTGEHGIGLHKMAFLPEEAGAGAVEMMRTLKRALDPDNIMNPGKIFTS